MKQTTTHLQDTELGPELGHVVSITCSSVAENFCCISCPVTILTLLFHLALIYHAHTGTPLKTRSQRKSKVRDLAEQRSFSCAVDIWFQVDIFKNWRCSGEEEEEEEEIYTTLEPPPLVRDIKRSRDQKFWPRPLKHDLEKWLTPDSTSVILPSSELRGLTPKA